MKNISFVLSFNTLVAQNEPCATQNISTIHAQNGSTLCDFTSLIQESEPSIIPEVDIYYIPVVVHIVHDNGPEKVSTESIEAEIDLLNYNFSGEGIIENDTKFNLY